MVSRARTAALVLGVALGLVPLSAAARMDSAAVCDRDQQVASYYCFHPYPSSYAQVDPAYSFGADRIQGKKYKPLHLARSIDRRPRARRLLRLRTAFKSRLRASAQAL